MKKIVKIITLIVLMIAVATSVVACKSADSPSEKWYNEEVFVFDVTDKTQSLPRHGTLTVTTKRINNANIDTGYYSVNEFYGTVIGWELVMEATTTKPVETIRAQSWTTNNQEPVLSYKKYDLADNTTEIHAKYESDRYRYKKDDQAEKTLSFKKGSALVDNESLYIALRVYDLDYSGFSATFNMPAPLLDEIQPIAVKSGSAVKVIVPLGTFDAIPVNVSINSKFPGRSITAYYSAKSYSSGVSAAMEFIPLRIEENSEQVIYELRSVTSK